MKRLFKNLSIAMLALAFMAACGENTSGANKKKNSGINGYGNGQTGYTTQGENYTSIDQVRADFNAKSLSDGIANNTNLYHVGTYFGGNAQGGGQVGVSIYGCLNLIFWEVGDCDSGNGGYDIDAYLQSALDMGRIWRTNSVGTNSVLVDEAYDVLNNDYLFQTVTYDRNDDIYREMLGLDRNDIVELRISAATVRLTNNQVIPATHIEYFYGANYTGYTQITGIQRFIVTKNLPTIANPVAVINSAGYLTGYLSNIGNDINVQSITIEKMHNFIYGSIQQVSSQQTVNLR
jgi:hypothetical protein